MLSVGAVQLSPQILDLPLRGGLELIPRSVAPVGLTKLAPPMSLFAFRTKTVTHKKGASRKKPEWLSF